jgi:hypothetical protein
LVSGHYWQPYIYFLVYKNYDPALFQKSGNSFGFDKYIFGGTNWDRNGRELDKVDLAKIAQGKSMLIAFSPLEYQKKQKSQTAEIGEIKDHSGTIIFILARLL